MTPDRFHVEVASVAGGKAGAKNAGYLAAQILATADNDLAGRLLAARQADAEAVVAKDTQFQERFR